MPPLCTALTVPVSHRLLSADQYCCSVCLDVQKEPVSLTCGHNYCLSCINGYWDISDEEGIYNCPLCSQIFNVRPVVKKNVMLKDLIAQLNGIEVCVSPYLNYSGPDDVPCDVCIGRKMRAVKSCLTCMASYCETHLQPHQQSEHSVNTQLPLLVEGLSDSLLDNCQVSSLIVLRNADLVSDIRAVASQNQQMKFFVFHVLLPSGSSLRSHHVSRFNLFFCSFSFLLSCPHSDFCTLTLDPNTANRRLRLSEKNKKVTDKRTVTPYPTHPDRFDFWPQVLCREALSGTRWYWEVQWSGERAVIGVAYKGIERKGHSDVCPLGSNDKSWCLFCSDSSYIVLHDNKAIQLSAHGSHRIGVYLDWPAGLLSFYSISYKMILLHSFNASFTEPLYPGFWVGPDSKSCLSPSNHLCYLGTALSYTAHALWSLEFHCCLQCIFSTAIGKIVIKMT
uniref:Tripartite motif-containing protein 16-like n=1 Tax=Erpetoichthys calabaricus TaxID=27687 RepID=A0A8C4X396_ERPCA